MQIIRSDYNLLQMSDVDADSLFYSLNILVDLFTIYNLFNLWRHNPLLDNPQTAPYTLSIIPHALFLMSA